MTVEDRSVAAADAGRPAAPVAVVGMGCRYPGADSPRELWENVLARRRAFRRFPDVRLPLADYSDPERTVANKIYSTKAALLADFTFDPVARRIPRSTFASTDIVHWLALETALDAVKDAGSALRTWPSERVGVIVGNSLTGEGPRNVAVQTRWPFFEHLLRGAAGDADLDAGRADALAVAAAARFHATLGEVDEDTLAGTLANTIAGRICNHLDLHGGGYVVDGACASSLLAVITAARALISGELDLALAGGVDVSLDPYELVGFAKAGALTPDEMRVYDARADGFVPGEGAGFVVLERLADARARGATIYAVLTGWGVSSDGRGGITAPTVAGQARAIAKAHRAAATPPSFVEGHGTGTAVGDRVELQALELALGGRGPRTCGVTSLKSVIGHTKAAAGIGGFIKTVVAVNRRVLPPTAGCEQPSEVFAHDAPSIHPLQHGRRLPHDSVVAAGVSAMGFGGINTHVRVESCGPPDPRLSTSLPENQVLWSVQDAELFVLTADSRTGLKRELLDLERVARTVSEAELTDLSAELARRSSSAVADAQAACRAAIVAARPERLAAACAALAARDEDVDDPSEHGGRQRHAPPAALRVGMLFPGQGSQQLGMGRQLVERFESARALFERLAEHARSLGAPDLTELIFRDVERASDAAEVDAWRRCLADTRAAQPALVITSLLWLQRLDAFGVRPSLVGGHSLGELSALHVAGALDAEQVVALATLRGQRMAELAEPGAMAGLACDVETAADLLAGVEGVYVANLNAPRQTVVGGSTVGVEVVLQRARDADVGGRRLEVSHAFHTPLVAAAVPVFRADIEGLGLGVAALDVPLWSSFAPQDGARTSIDLPAYLAQQIAAPVRFADLARGFVAAVDTTVEVGPGAVLSGLLAPFAARPTLCQTEHRAESSVSFLHTLATLFVHGGLRTLAPLHEDRMTRPFVPPARRAFLGNPLAAVTRAAGAVLRPPRAAIAPSAAPPASAGDPRAIVLDLLAARTGFDRTGLRDEQRLLDDLNVDSIKAADLVATAAQRLRCEAGIDARAFAGSTIGEVVRALQKASDAGASTAGAAGPARGGPSAPRSAATWLAARPAWMQAYTLSWQVDAAPVGASVAPRLLACIAAASDDDWASTLQHSLQTPPSTGENTHTNGHTNGPTNGHGNSLHILCMRDLAADAQAFRKAVSALSRWVRTLPDDPAAHLALVVRRDDGAVATPAPEFELDTLGWLASVQLERGVRCTWLSLPAGCDAPTAAQHLRAECAGDQPLRAVRIDDSGRRTTRVRHRHRLPSEAAALQPGDVVVVTGGARGITSACASALAAGSGAHFVLVGRSPARDVHAELLALRRAGVACSYASVDLGDGDAVHRLVERVWAKHRRVDVVIHGAGTNVPRRVEAAEEGEVLAEIGAKVLGVSYLLAALAARPPRLVVALTSTIGRTGMAGNAWYALANASLAQSLQRLGRRHGVARAFCVGFGLWGEIGLGARLRSHERLAHLGVSALPPGVAAEAFARVTRSVSDTDLVSILPDSGADEVLITSRMSALPTWTALAKETPLPTRIELGRIGYEPGVELCYETRLDVQEDAHVTDHAFAGSLLYPAVLSLARMVEAARCVLGRGGGSHLRLEHLELHEPLVVDEREGLAIRVHAEVASTGASTPSSRVLVAVYSERDGFAAARHSVEVRFDAPSPGDLPSPPASTSSSVLGRDEVYRTHLFQTGDFQRIESVVDLARDRCTARLRRDVADASSIGDPFALDAMLQTAQLCLAPRSFLPVRIDRIDIAAEFTAATTDRVWCETRVGAMSEDEVEVEVDACDETGRVLVRMTGYRVRAVGASTGEQTLLEAEVPAAIADAAGRHGFVAPPSDLCPMPGMHGQPATARHAAQAPTLARLVQGIDGHASAGIAWRGERPVVDGHVDVAVSAAHDDRHFFCVVGRGAQGCDIVEVEPRPASRWWSMLGPGAAAARELFARGFGLDAAASMAWAAQECVFKAIGRMPSELRVLASTHRDCVLGAPDLADAAVLAMPVALAGTALGKVLALVVRPAPVREGVS